MQQELNWLITSKGNKMDTYLKEQYNVYEDAKYLTDESLIVEIFKDIGEEYFDCGEGYLQEEVEVICHINDKFYLVFIEAEITSCKQDRGDRLYWVDYIKDVTYKEIEKPPKKDDSFVVMYIESYKKQLVSNILKSEGINFKFEDE